MITFSVRLSEAEQRTLELFVIEHCLAKKLLNDSVLNLHRINKYFDGFRGSFYYSERIS